MKQPSESRLLSAVVAGILAITFSTLVLKAAPMFNIKAEGGGLLKLLLSMSGNISKEVLFSHAEWFALLFHYLTGLLMVLIYVYLFNPLIPMLPGWLKGTIFSFFPWVINGLIVLPMLGSKIFGYDQMPLAGLIFFFFANLIFGLFTGWLYERFIPLSRYYPGMSVIDGNA